MLKAFSSSALPTPIPQPNLEPLIELMEDFSENFIIISSWGKDAVKYEDGILKRPRRSLRLRIYLRRPLISCRTALR
jgi:hypothetical protein